MIKKELIGTFSENHKVFIGCIASVADDKFVSSSNGKWSPGQQLDHVYLCLVPLEKILGSKAFIEQKFGTIKRPVLSYNEVISNYKTALEKGGTAPSKFVPQKVEAGRKEELINMTYATIDKIYLQLDSYTENELDTLILPHPLLGELTIREMFYLMAYHATHHLDQTKKNLN